MEAKESAVITFRVSQQELETIEAGAAQVGMNRADYVRSQVLAPDSNARVVQLKKQLDSLTDRLGRAAEQQRVEDLVKHAIYLANQIYTGIFSIAEAQGKAGRFLNTEQLREVYDRVRADALRYAVEFPEHFEVVQAEIAAAANTRG
jgi:hypothetical protein